MNVTFTIILVLILIVTTLVGIIHVTIRINKQLKAKNNHLSGKIEQLNANIAYLVKHSDELAQIRRKKEKTFESIEEAKTNEEIADIVSVIIDSNNQRVQNLPKK